MADESILELRSITKRFPGIVANDGIDFDLRRGEAHALLGENGAGKSTLMNVVFGLYQPDEGEIRVKGEPAAMKSPRDAINHGIGMVHQHFMLVPVMTIAENIALANAPTHAGVLLDMDAAEKRVAELSRTFHFALDPRARIENITVGQQQRVEILKALDRNADILILDEPTAVLTPQEATELFGIIKNLQAEGTSIIFISHKLNEVLEIDGLNVRDDRGLPAVRDVSLTVRAGEIVGIAGVDGNGQTELIDALSGLRRSESGRIVLAGRDITNRDARYVLDAGYGHVPEDRQRRGLVLDFSLAENIALHDYAEPPDSRFGWLFPGRLIARARRLLQEFDVRGGGPRTRAAALSGGNQQKVVLAREIGRDPRVLLAAQPTRGLDVGAIEFVHRRLVEERDEGRAILLVSLELEEILSLADRILVIYEGRIVGEFGPDVSEEELGIAMTGGGRETEAA